VAWPTATAAATTFRNDASGTTFTFTLSVTAGDQIAIVPKWEGSSSDTTLTTSDGVNTYTDHFSAAHPVAAAAGEPWTSLITAVAATTASLSITVTLGAARTWREGHAVAIRPDAAGTISLDGTPAGTGGISGSVATGNTTTTGQSSNCGLSIVAYGGYGDDPSSEQINGGAADFIVGPVAPANSELWARRYTSGFTGQGTATIGFNNWAAGIVSFKIVAAGGGAAASTLMLMGMGP